MRLTTDYLEILRDLQPDRFMKNVLYNPLYELYTLYKNNGNSDDWFLQYLYYGISVRRTDEGKYRYYLTIKKSYHHTVFVLMLRYSHYQCDDYHEENQEELDLIAEELITKYPSIHQPIHFDQLKADGLYEKATKGIKWIFKRKDFVFNELEKIDLNSFGKKRTFESMLDQL